MNKKCARPECGKTVYPLEELKCLDKVWHKQCFKCAVCGMTLNMKNYKGYEKTPYCEAHYPKTVASVVADTPEMRRLAENTKNQSLVKYHEEFERMKGSKIQIADDPEVQRHMKNTNVVSQAIYHGDINKKEHMEKIRPPLEESSMMKVAPQSRPVGSIADYDPINGNWGSAASTRPIQQQNAAQFRQPQQQQQAPMGVSGPHRRSGGVVVRAMYDYSAADSDEVTFAEGDVIVGCHPVDEGWLTGTVQRTGQWGMLPANYVERVH